MENKENLSKLEMKLTDIEKNMKEIITTGLEIIKAEPSLEKDVITMFMTPSMKIYNHFIRETERTGTENVGKSVFKYAMFKKF